MVCGRKRQDTKAISEQKEGLRLWSEPWLAALQPHLPDEGQFLLWEHSV